MKKKFAKLTKIIAFALSVLMLLVSLAGCSKSDEDDSVKKPGTTNHDKTSDDTEESVAGDTDEVVTDAADTKKYNILHIGEFSDGLALITTDLGQGYIDVNGLVKIAPTYMNEEGFELIAYEDASSFSNGLARVKIDGKYGYINTDGEIAIDAVYESADESFGALALVKKEGISQYINAKGEAVYSATGKEVKIGEFCNGLFWVETVEELISGNVNTITYYNEKGEAAFSINAENAGDLSSFTDLGYAIVKIMRPDGQYETDKDYKLIDRSGAIAEWAFDGVAPNYTTLKPYSQNYYFYTNYYDGGWGNYHYIDFENKKVYPTPTIYNKHLGKNYYYTSSGYEYDESLFQKAGDIILREDQIVLRLYDIQEFGGADIVGVDYCSYNDKDCFWVYLRNNSGVPFISLIDIDGNVMITPTKDYTTVYRSTMHADEVYFAYDVVSGLCKAKDTESGLFGFIDMTGNWVIKPQYGEVSDFSGEGDNAVAVADHNTIINRRGEVIFTTVNEKEE